jgi:hypothetical protein
MTAVQLSDQRASLDEVPLVSRYFALFNQGEYRQVAALFAPDGSLCPPFESPVVGPVAIATYLIQEADGMQADLLSAQVQPLANGCLQVTVRGKVTALVFKVTVAWQFMLTAQNQIASVQVNLLASLEELLKLRPA